MSSMSKAAGSRPAFYRTGKFTFAGLPRCNLRLRLERKHRASACSHFVSGRPFLSVSNWTERSFSLFFAIVRLGGSLSGQ